MRFISTTITTNCIIQYYRDVLLLQNIQYYYQTKFINLSLIARNFPRQRITDYSKIARSPLNYKHVCKPLKLISAPCFYRTAFK